MSHITERLDSLIQLLGNGLLAQAIQLSQNSFNNKGKKRPPMDGENLAHAKRPTSRVRSGDSHHDPSGANSHQENVSDSDHSHRVSVKAPSEKEIEVSKDVSLNKNEADKTSESYVSEWASKSNLSMTSKARAFKDRAAADLLSLVAQEPPGLKHSNQAVERAIIHGGACG